MNRLFTLLVALLACLTAHAQYMSVESFSVLENDMDARTHYRKLDQNGRVAAIIKVESTAKGFSFDVGSLGVVDIDHTKTAETWVYVPSGVIRITIQHDELGTIRDYEIPIAVREATVYRMVLSCDEITRVVNQRASGQYLIVDVTPADAEATISVDGGVPIPIVDGTYSPLRLPYGEHTFTIAAPLYQTHTQTVVSRADAQSNRIRASVELEPRFGYLTIESTPQAKVTINNMAVGSTPIKQMVDFGNYEVKLSAPNYATVSQSVTVSEPLQEAIINETLTPYFSQIELSVAMSEAAIYINDQLKDTGTWRGILMPGAYDIKVAREGYRPTIKTIEVAQNRAQSISLDSPTPITGSLDVGSNVIDAILYIDGRRLGETPNFFEDIVVGDHTLELRHKNYTSQTKTARVEEGKVCEVNFTLQRSAAAKSDPTSAAKQTSAATTNAKNKPTTHPTRPTRNSSTIVLAQASYHPSQISYGAMVGYGGKVRGYVKYMDSFNSVSPTTAECDDQGLSGGESYNFVQDAQTKKVSITAGIIAPLKSSNLFCYIGGGYGSRKLIWESLSGEYMLNSDHSATGFALDAGLILQLGHLALSAGLNTIPSHTFNELNIGLGITF